MKAALEAERQGLAALGRRTGDKRDTSTHRKPVKPVVAISQRKVILVGQEKLVDRLGTRGRIPIEVVPFACPLVLRRVRALGLDPVIRLADGRPFVSDNGNRTVDCGLTTPLADASAARALNADLRAIPGVVDTGLFLGTAERVLVGYPDGHVDMLEAGR